jgi:hypothetical protein
MNARWPNGIFVLVALLMSPACSSAGPASDALPTAVLLAGRAGPAPNPNAAFYPGSDALAAPAFSAVLSLQQTPMQTKPEIDRPLQDGRDARLFPAVTLEFFTLDGLLVPVQRGEMVRETPGAKSSFWHVIPQVGRIWRESADGGWSRAAFPVMLVNDTDNDAHQGLATFVYRDAEISTVAVQFVQQSAPYLLGRHFIAWTSVHADLMAADANALADRRSAVRAELAARLPAKPLRELAGTIHGGAALDGFGGPLNPKFLVEAALVRGGTLYYEEASTPYGTYPYPLEMRFGVRSVMKSVGAPLALLHLAEVYGPWVLTLKVGDYVAGLDPKWKRIRFLDAANMSTGFGGTGTLKTNPNDILDG